MIETEKSVNGLAPETSERLQAAVKRGVVRRLPLTFLPFVNQQLREWDVLFPNERGAVERLLLFVDGQSEEENRALFRSVVELEDKMGVRKWQFSTTEQTIQNSSLLARSPHFPEWRKAVQGVFDAADSHAIKAGGPERRRVKRAILIDIPASLPVNHARVWQRWQGIGRVVKVDVASGQAFLNEVLQGAPEGNSGRGLFQSLRTESKADAWLIDAGVGLERGAGEHRDSAIVLSYARLDNFRESFSHAMNTMRKDLSDADTVFERLRQTDVQKWCPPDIREDVMVREFVRSLFLSGNGAVIFGNSFVEWGASEALRRARPVVLAARFGVRSKPKPFTGVAVFENPDQVNPQPAVDDVEGSALDAEMLALYIWLAANRYDEYRSNTVCVCVAESIGEAYVVSPDEFSFGPGSEPVSMDRLGRALTQWVS